MAFPINTQDRIWERNWPSPIVFHESNPGKPLQQVMLTTNYMKTYATSVPLLSPPPLLSAGSVLCCEWSVSS